MRGPCKFHPAVEAERVRPEIQFDEVTEVRGLGDVPGPPLGNAVLAQAQPFERGQVSRPGEEPGTVRTQVVIVQPQRLQRPEVGAGTQLLDPVAPYSRPAQVQLAEPEADRVPQNGLEAGKTKRDAPE